MKPTSKLALALLLALTTRVDATHPVSEEPVRCAVDGAQVKLTWERMHFFAPIEGYVIARDNQPIGKAAPDSFTWTDESAPDGEHVYTVTAINFDGSPIDIGSCTAVVGDFGIGCRVEETTVHLKWGPILIDIAFSHFSIARDGEIIARVDRDELEFADRDVPPGRHRYVVRMVIDDAHSIVLGACTVRVQRTGFLCRVDGARVTVDWSRVPLPEIPIEFFLVVRNGERIARTREHSFTDEPGPGEHRYAVWAILTSDEPANLAHDGVLAFLVGDCRVAVGDDRVPPPEELTCVDLDAARDVSPALDEVDFLRAHDVLLVWQKPVDYDHVIIARNGAIVARIDGDQFYYVDRNVPAGEYLYSVSGVVGDRISAPAECTVVLPRPPLPPPVNLRCRFVSTRPVDAADVTAPGFVRLDWENGARYDAVVIVHNGRKLAVLPGDAARFDHTAPPPGVNRYRVFGVRGLRRSEAAECAADVPIGTVPPVENLACVLVVHVDVPLAIDAVANEDAVDGGGILPAPPTVFIRWDLPAIGDRQVEYDRILISRGAMLIATLPGNASSYHDRPPLGPTKVEYSVVGVIGDRRSAPESCVVDLPPIDLPPPQNLVCNVVAVRDDRPSVVVGLKWENIVEYEAIVVERNGEPLAKLHGDAMVYTDISPPAGVHHYAVYGIDTEGRRSRRARCEVEVPAIPVPPVAELECFALATDIAGPVAILRWSNAGDYDRLLILRNGELADTLPGDAEMFQDFGLEPGVHHYAVVAIVGDRRSAPAECRVVIPGPPPDHLYFSSGVFVPVDEEPKDELAAVAPMLIPGQITALASHGRPLQGWSFGVCSDPSVLVPAEAGIDGTTAGALNGGEGPQFLHIETSTRGVVMAAMVHHELETTLPVASNDSLLRIRYAKGPDAECCTPYPVRYCNRLGDPAVDVLFVVEGFEVRPETSPGSVFFAGNSRPGFIRGDSNGDGSTDVSDPMFSLNYLFVDGKEPPCREAADANGSGDLNIADPIYHLQHLFDDGPAPPAPYPDCGIGPAPSGCEVGTCPVLAL